MMTATTIRKKLHALIDNADDKKAKELYSLFEKKLSSSPINKYNEDLEEAENEFKLGNYITHSEMKAKIKKWKQKKAV